MKVDTMHRYLTIYEGRLWVISSHPALRRIHIQWPVCQMIFHAKMRPAPIAPNHNPFSNDWVA